MEIAFLRPVYLWFLLSLPLMLLVHSYTLRYSRRKALRFANFEAIERVRGEKVFTSNAPLLVLRLIILAAIILALSGMVLWYSARVSEYNFVLAIDASSSMTSDDIKPDRLEAARKEALNFVDSIGGKAKIGVVSFSGVVFIDQELTGDASKVRNAINNIAVKTIGGTNIGGAIINAGNLMLVEDRPGVIVLLTDGQSNVGVTLREAIDYANRNHIIVHTIGLGTEAGGRFADLDITSQIDEESLRLIALNTDGNYYRAADEVTLSEAYKEISRISKQKISLNLTPFLIVLALLLLFMEWAWTTIGITP